MTDTDNEELVLRGVQRAVERFRDAHAGHTGVTTRVTAAYDWAMDCEQCMTGAGSVPQTFTWWRNRK